MVTLDDVMKMAANHIKLELVTIYGTKHLLSFINYAETAGKCIMLGQIPPFVLHSTFSSHFR